MQAESLLKVKSQNAQTQAKEARKAKYQKLKMTKTVMSSDMSVQIALMASTFCDSHASRISHATLSDAFDEFTLRICI